MPDDECRGQPLNRKLDQREQEYREAGVMLSKDPKRSGSWTEPTEFRILCNRELPADVRDRMLEAVQEWSSTGMSKGYGPTTAGPRRMHSEVTPTWTHASQLEIYDIDLGSAGIFALYALLDILVDVARHEQCRFMVYSA